MAIESLSAVPPGSDVFIDANIFIYGLNGQSPQCHDFFQRCAREEVFGITSFEVLSEVLHQLMLAEAVTKGLIVEQNWRLLRKNPQVVSQLHDYWSQVEQILGLNFLVLGLEEKLFRRSQAVRRSYGLLTNDSLYVAAMEEYGLDLLATNDNDFGSIPTLTVYKPTDA